MGIASAIAAVGGGILGGIGGSKKDITTQTRQLGPSTAFQRKLQDLLPGRLEGLFNISELGFSEGRVSQARDEQFGFAEEAARIGREGFQATDEDVRGARRFGSQVFQGQRLALQQQFEQEEVDATRLSAQLGRAPDDPILRAKLARSRTQQQLQLGAAQGSFEAQQIFAAPRERFQTAGLAAQQFENFAQQAFSNRAAAFGLASNVLSQQQQFQLGQSGITEASGGGLKGALAGILSGAGSGAKIGQSFGSTS